MSTVGVLCLCAAVVVAIVGLRTLTRPATSDPGQQALRALAPTQFAASVMLAAGGAVALVGETRTALPLLIICIAGALATVAVGSWQGARYMVRRAAVQPVKQCAGSCAACTLSCH